MGITIPDKLETEEMQLLIDLCSYEKPFVLNDAFQKFNHHHLSKLHFYMQFFWLQILKLVRVEHLPPFMLGGSTNITYVVTLYGKDVVILYKSINKDFFLKEEE